MKDESPSSAFCRKYSVEAHEGDSVFPSQVCTTRIADQRGTTSAESGHDQLRC